jgi:hypothetical protein
MNEFEKQVATAFTDVGTLLAISTVIQLFKLSECTQFFDSALRHLKEQNFPPEVIDEVSERLAGILAEKAKRDEEVSK